MACRTVRCRSTSRRRTTASSCWEIRMPSQSPTPVLGALVKLGRVTLFLGRIVAQCLPSLRYPRLLVAQIYNAGARSLIIVMLCGLFVGMVLGLQGYDLLQRFGSESSLGVAAALGLVKELGPVITVLLLAGRAWAWLTSEIVLIPMTDQLITM